MPWLHNQNGGGKHARRWACGDYADPMDVDNGAVAGDQRRRHGQSDKNQLVIAETIDLTDDTRPHKRAVLPSSATTANAKKRTFSMAEEDDAPVAAQARIKRPQLAADPKTSGPVGMRHQEGGEWYAHQGTAAPQIRGRDIGALRLPRTPGYRNGFEKTVQAFQDHNGVAYEVVKLGLQSPWDIPWEERRRAMLERLLRNLRN